MLCSVCYQAKRKEGFTVCELCLVSFNREVPDYSIKRAVEWAANRARDFALAKRLRKKSGKKR
jgi:hypothetical protein